MGIVAVIVALGARRGRDSGTEVSVIRPVKEDLSSWVSSNGKIEPIESHILQAQLTAFIEKIHVNEGQAVSAGQTLATLDTRELRTDLTHAREQLNAAERDQQLAHSGGSPEEVTQLENDLAKINAEIGRLQTENERAQRLYSRNAATKQEADQAKNDLDRAQRDRLALEERKKARTQRLQGEAERAGSRVEDVRVTIRAIEAKLNSAEIKAPVSGIVYSLPAKAGVFVHTGDTIAELADLKRVRTRAFVDEPELGSLSAGQPVEISWDATPNRKWPGQVEQLPKAVVARGSRSVGEVLCSVDNKDLQLLPNVNVNVRIRTAEHDNVLAIPRGAIRPEGDKRFVLVAEDGKLRKQEVMLGISNATMYEVLGGLKESDVVALAGPIELHEGMIVSVKEQR
jgi:HlyD family secretion protein